MAYNAGDIESTLTLDRSPFQAGLDAAKREAEEFENKRYAANLDAELRELNAKLDEAEKKLEEFAGKDPTAKLDADGTEVTTKVDEADRRLDEYAEKNPTATLDVDNAGADAKLDETAAKADELAAKSPTVRPEVDSAEADAKLAATAAAADALGEKSPEVEPRLRDADFMTQMGALKVFIDDTTPPIRELKIEMQIADAMARLETLHARLQEVSGKPQTVEVRGEIEDLENKIARAQLALFGLVDKHVTIDADDNGSFARIITEEDIAKAKADELAATRPTVTITANDADYTAKVVAAKEAADRIPALKETVMRAQIAEAISNVETLEARLKVLTGQPEEVQIRGEIADLAAKVDQAKLKLAELVDKRVTVHYNDEGSIDSIKVKADEASDSLTKVGTSGREGFSQMQTYASIGAAALPPVSAAILAIPGALALVAAPAAAVVLGMDGIKQSAIGLTPAFGQVKNQASDAFTAGLAPAISNVNALLPTLGTGLAGTATALSTVATGVTGVVASTAGLQTMSTIFSGINSIISQSSGWISQFVTNLMQLTTMGTAGLSTLNGVMLQVGQAWQQVISELQQSGVGAAAIQQLVAVVGSLLSALAPIVQLGAQVMAAFGPALSGALQATAQVFGGLASIFGALPGPLQTIAIAAIAARVAMAALGPSATQAAAGVTALGAAEAASAGEATAAAAAQSRLAGVTGLLATPVRAVGSALTEMRTAYTTASEGATGFSSVATGVGAALRSGLGSAVSGLTAALGGPWGVAIIGASVVLDQWGQHSQQAAQAAQQHQQAVTNLASALQNSNGVITSQVTSVVTSSQAYQDASLNADKLGISQQTLTAAATGNVGALNQVNAATKSSADTFEKWFGDAQNGIPIIRSLGGAIDPVGKSASDLRTQVAELSKTWTDAQQKNQQLASSLQQSGAAMLGSVGNTKALADAMEKLKEESTSAADKVKALQTAMDLLNGGTQALESSSRSMHQDIDNLGKSFTGLKGEVTATNPLIDQLTGGIETVGPAGQKASEAMQKLGQDTQASAEYAFNAAGGLSNLSSAQQAATAQAQQGYNAFQTLGRSLGLTDTQIQQLAQHYGLIPAQIVTTLTTNAPAVVQEVQALNAELQKVPPGKSITVTAPTQDAQQQLQQLGITVQQVPGTKQVILTAPNQQALASLQAFIDKANSATGTPKIDANPAPANAKDDALKNKIQQPATKPIDANPSPAQGKDDALKNQAQQPATKPIDAEGSKATGVLSQIVSAITGTTATLHINAESAPANGILTGFVGTVNGTTAIAHINAEMAPAIGILAQWVASVNGTTAIAHLNADPAQANQVLQTWVSAVNGTTGTAKIAANAAQAQATLSALIAQINSSVGTVTIRANKVGFAAGGVAPAGFAEGGINPGPLVRRYAEGGMEDNAKQLGLTPMPVGIPAIVPPNTMRVVGDRSDVDEFYIPDNSDARSIGLLGELANRRSYALAPLKAGPGQGAPPVVKMADGGLLSMVDAMVGELGQVTLSALADARSSSGTGSTITSEQAQQIIDAIHELRDTIASARPVDARTTINNPVAETGADSTAARLRTLSALGVFG